MRGEIKNRSTVKVRHANADSKATGAGRSGPISTGNDSKIAGMLAENSDVEQDTKYRLRM